VFTVPRVLSKRVPYENVKQRTAKGTSPFHKALVPRVSKHMKYTGIAYLSASRFTDDFTLFDKTRI
jgi:hypothetical protein